MDFLIKRFGHRLCGGGYGRTGETIDYSPLTAYGRIVNTVGDGRSRSLNGLFRAVAAFHQHRHRGRFPYTAHSRSISTLWGAAMVILGSLRYAHPSRYAKAVALRDVDRAWAKRLSVHPRHHSYGASLRSWVSSSLSAFKAQPHASSRPLNSPRVFSGVQAPGGFCSHTGTVWYGSQLNPSSVPLDKYQLALALAAMGAWRLTRHFSVRPSLVGSRFLRLWKEPS